MGVHRFVNQAHGILPPRHGCLPQASWAHRCTLRPGQGDVEIAARPGSADGTEFGEASSDLKVHLCLQFSAEEAQRNADAFLRALLADPAPSVSNIKDRVVVVPEGDALDVASTLASKYIDQVLLVNGANRQLIGNHWFDGRAKMAIDENLHRRSWRLSAIAYILNNYKGKLDLSQRKKHTLERRMLDLGGKVKRI